MVTPVERTGHTVTCVTSIRPVKIYDYSLLGKFPDILVNNWVPPQVVCSTKLNMRELSHHISTTLLPIIGY